MNCLLHYNIYCLWLYPSLSNHLRKEIQLKTSLDCSLDGILLKVLYFRKIKVLFGVACANLYGNGWPAESKLLFIFKIQLTLTSAPFLYGARQGWVFPIRLEIIRPYFFFTDPPLPKLNIISCTKANRFFMSISYFSYNNLDGNLQNKQLCTNEQFYLSSSQIKQYIFPFGKVKAIIKTIIEPGQRNPT